MKLFFVIVSCLAIISNSFYISYTTNSRKSNKETKTFVSIFQCFLYLLLLKIVEQSFFEGSSFLYPLLAVLPFIIIERIISYSTRKNSSY